MKVKLFVLALAGVLFIPALSALIDAILNKNGVVAIFIFIGLYILAKVIKNLFKSLKTLNG